MIGIIVNNLINNSEKLIEFYSNNNIELKISENTKKVNITKGNHQIKLIRHHDLFLDWYVDNKLIEEFLVLPLISDELSCLIIKSTDLIETKNKDVFLTDKDNYNKSIFPILLEFNESCKFVIKCINLSQISFFFQENKEIDSRGKDYETITLVFNTDYCKVFKDFYKEREFNRELRENMGLFKCSQNETNIIGISKKNNKMIVSNKSEGSKEYDLSNIFLNNKKIIYIEETYRPNGPGKYIIETI